MTVTQIYKFYLLEYFKNILDIGRWIIFALLQPGVSYFAKLASHGSITKSSYLMIETELYNGQKYIE